MTTPHARCESCGLSLPPNAFRCPTCGHQQGEAITVEVGRRSSAGSRSASPHRRRDLIALGGVVAVVLAGLVFAGRDSGGREKAAANATTTTTSRPTTTSTSTSTTTTAPTTTTATTLPGLQLGAPAGIKLLVANEDGFISLIDLDTGAMSRPAMQPAYVYVPRPGGVVVNSQSAQTTFIREPYDRPGTDLGAADNFFASSFEDRVWLVRYLELAVTLTEVDLTGAVTAGPFSVPQAQVAGAVREGVVLSLHGSIYVVDRAGSARRIASGDALSAGGDFVFAAQCDDQLVCGVVLINVATGTVRELPDLRDSATQGFPVTFSADATKASVLLARQTEPTRLVLIDLPTGKVSSLEDAVVGFSPTAPSFSRDSQWLVFTTGLETTAYRLGTNEKRVLALGGTRISSLVAV
ncbi:MAG: hypothetical protein QOD92_760 [Acidimicrobiaceae bacterium]|jgi:hypothetical protein